MISFVNKVVCYFKNIDLITTALFVHCFLLPFLFQLKKCIIIKAGPIFIPQDVGVNLVSTVPPEKCAIFPKQIHVWSGHKGKRIGCFYLL